MILPDDARYPTFLTMDLDPVWQMAGKVFLFSALFFSEIIS
jgi:hypothetical protein